MSAPKEDRGPKWFGRLRSSLWREPKYAVDKDLALTEEGSAEEIVVEYWKRSFQSADSARARAQAGFAIVSAVATLFISGSALSGIQEQSAITKIAAVVASLLWLTTVGLYLNAATAANKPGKSLGGPANDLSNIDPPRRAGEWGRLLHQATLRNQIERSSLIWRTRRSNVFGMMASIASVLTFSALMFSPPPTESDSQVVLTSAGASAVAGYCGTYRLALEGEIDSKDLEKQFVGMTLHEDQACRGFRNLTLRREWVAVTVAPD